MGALPHAPVCVPCQRLYKPAKNGFYFVEAMPIVPDAPPGTIFPEGWKPYKVWLGDKWKCEGCLSEIVIGVGQRPVSEHYRPDFSATIMNSGAAQLQVNDC